MTDDRRILEGIERLIVDGTNFIHALGQVGSPLPPVALIGRLRAIVPPSVAVTVVLDGSPEWGLVARQLAAGLEVRHSGRFSADELILRLVTTTPFGAGGGGGRGGLLVVTNDIELSESIRRAGARTVRNTWLIDRLGRQRLASPSPGRPTAPSPDSGSPAPDSPAEDAHPSLGRWSPGRGATRKRGNPRRRPMHGSGR